MNTYATWNPSDKASGVTLSNGNLTATTNQGANTGVRSTIGKSTGKWYWEITGTSTGYEPINGVADLSESLTLCGLTTHGWGYWGLNGNSYHNSSNSSAGGFNVSYGIGDVIGFALDADAGTLKCYKNNTLIGTITLTGVSTPYYAMVSNASGSQGMVLTANFGASSQVYSPPAGYNAGLYDVS